MTTDEDLPTVGDRVIVRVSRRGQHGLETFDAAGIVVSTVDSVRAPFRPVLGYVRMDDRDLGERAEGLRRLRRECAP